MQKYKPTLALPSRPVQNINQLPVTAPHRGLNIYTQYCSNGDAGQTLQPSQAIPSTNKPLLNEHKALGKLLLDYLNSPSAGVAQVPNQFKALPNWTLNVGTKNVIGVDTTRVSSQKRRANDIPETEIRSFKKSRGTGSSMHTPLSSIQGLKSVKEDGENSFESEEEGD